MSEYYGFNIDALNAAVDYRRSTLVRAGARRSAGRQAWWRRRATGSH